MVMHTLTFEEPFFIFLIVPLIVILLTTSKKFLFYMDLIILTFFNIICLYSDSNYIDCWILLTMIIIIIIYSSKAKFIDFYLSITGQRIELEGTEKYIYDRDFKILFNEEEFGMLMNIAQMKRTKEQINLAVEGEKIERVIYLATIPHQKNLILKAKDTVISYLKEGAWLGIIEFNLFLNNAEKTNNPFQENPKWLVNLCLEKDSAEIVYYEWDFISLINLFKFSHDYKFTNKIMMLWSKYLAHTMSRLDDHLVNSLKAMIENDKQAKLMSNPSVRWNKTMENRDIEIKNDFLEIDKEVYKRKKSNLNKVGMDISEIKE